MEQKHIVAFEIGSSCIKGAVAVTAPGDDAHVKVVAIAEEPLRDKVRYGIVENPGDVAACINSLAHRLQHAHGVEPRLIKEAYVGISGRSVASVANTVSREFHAEMEITASVIDDLLDEAVQSPIGDRLVIDVAPVAFSVDAAASPYPVGTFGHSVSARVNLITCKPKMKNNIDRVFHERCGINIAGFIVTPLAIAEQTLTTEERRLGVMLADFGAETTTVVIYREGVMQYLATIPMGGRNITRDLTSLNCLEERAEEIKKAVGDAMPPPAAADMITDGLDNVAINNIASARADEIISNLLEHIAYAGYRPDQLPAGIVVTGGATRLRNLPELVASLSKMKVRRATLGSAVTLAPGIAPALLPLDVISLVASAAADSPVECTEMPEAASVAAGPDSYDGYDNYDPFGPGIDGHDRHGRPAEISRIGTSDDDDSDDILSDGFSDDDAPSRKKGRDKKPGKAPDKTPSSGHKGFSISSIMENCKKKVAGLMKEREDEYGDDEE